MMDRSMFVLRNGPVGCAVACSGWRRARGGGVENDKLAVEKPCAAELAVEKPCAAGRLSCGPTSAADCFTTYASNRIIQVGVRQTMLKHCYRLKIGLDAVDRCSSETYEALASPCAQFVRRKAVKTFEALRASGQ